MGRRFLAVMRKNAFPDRLDLVKVAFCPAFASVSPGIEQYWIRLDCLRGVLPGCRRAGASGGALCLLRKGRIL